MALLQLLRQNPKVQELPITQREIYFRFAELFEDHELALYQTPKELALAFAPTGTTQQWAEFLQLDPVITYINAQLAQVTKIGYRKSLPALMKAAQSGDTQAAGQLAKMSNILDGGETNKIIVMHYVPRPKQHSSVSKEDSNAATTQ